MTSQRHVLRYNSILADPRLIRTVTRFQRFAPPHYHLYDREIYQRVVVQNPSHSHQLTRLPGKGGAPHCHQHIHISGGDAPHSHQ